MMSWVRRHASIVFIAFGLLLCVAGVQMRSQSVKMTSSVSYYKCSDAQSLSCLNDSNKVKECTQKQVTSGQCAQIVSDGYDTNDMLAGSGLAIFISGVLTVLFFSSLLVVRMIAALLRYLF